MRGGKKRGCLHLIGAMPAHVLLLAEGFATGASLFECLSVPIAVCFDAYNLLPVSKAMLSKWPTSRLIIAADNDTGVPGNPGLRAAEEAALETGADVAFPRFSDSDVLCGLSDWNDVHQKYGCRMVRQLLEPML